MDLYSSELAAFEEFCRSEFRQIFVATENVAAGPINAINSLQKQVLAANAVNIEPSFINSQFESIEYSFFSGGKRFRPMLCFAGAQYLDIPLEKVYPWAMAIEMIHTYSLIHDDLPCMDNDDFRRGKLTNHKIFGEAVALLAGDSLLTEAFAVLANHYGDSPVVFGLLVKQLSAVSGISGMILGQYFDMSLESGKIRSSVSHLNKIHLLKTGALICGALMGPALLKNLDTKQIESMKEIGFLLGYAFQVKDDILDSDQDKNSPKNLIHHFQDKGKLGQFLEQIHQIIRAKIIATDIQIGKASNNDVLLQFLKWNANRDK
jgi:geranylgeranyl pyrophosphate synthase